MIPLIGAVFLASLLGSTHCAGMCGAFVVFAVAGGKREDQPHPVLLHGAYNFGRLVVYVCMGMVGGLAGATLELGASLAGVQHAAAMAAGAMMAGIGVVTLLRIKGVAVPKAPVPAPMRRLAERGHRTASKQPPIFRALLTGLLTTLLPCGWLYAFVITAAGTGHPLTGALVMAFFWLGTLPIMIAVGVTVKKLTGPIARRVPAMMGLLLVGVGLYTLVGRTDLIPSTEGMFAQMEYQKATTGEIDFDADLVEGLPCHESH
ncbi:MAG: sulfite exporter TauE/SafE family protein [Phycisphaerales bacterium]